MNLTDRAVTITADDLGLDPAVNAAIADLARAGRLHAASLLIDAPHAAGALTTELPPAVGLHVQVREPLLASGTSAQIHAEITRQWQRMTSPGHPPRHLDLHTLALYGLGPDPVRPGGVLPEAVAVAGDHGVPLRLPRELPPGVDVDEAARAAHQRLVEAAEVAGVVLPQTIISDFRPPHLIACYADLRDHYRDLIASLPTGRSEIFLHPALPQATADDDEPTAAQQVTVPQHAPGQVPLAGGETVAGEQVDPDLLAAGAEDAGWRKRVWEYHLLASGDLHQLLAAAGVAPEGTTDWPTRGLDGEFCPQTDPGRWR